MSSLAIPLCLRGECSLNGQRSRKEYRQTLAPKAADRVTLRHDRPKQVFHLFAGDPHQSLWAHVRLRMRNKATSLDYTASIDEVIEEYLLISHEDIPSALGNRLALKEEIEKLPHDLKAAVLEFAHEMIRMLRLPQFSGCTPKAVETRRYRVMETACEKIGCDLLSPSRLALNFVLRRRERGPLPAARHASS
jgi:hypothetical protein